MFDHVTIPAASMSGPRSEYGEDYFGACLLDPDGNSAEAVHHGTPAERQ